MERGTSGQFEVLHLGGEEVRAFVPTPLPPEIVVGLNRTATSAVDTAQRLVALFQEDAARVQAAGRGAATRLRVLHALHERPIITINEVSRRTGLSFPTSAKGMTSLIDLDLARELTGYRRNLVFAYDRYLAILAEGTEPL